MRLIAVLALLLLAAWPTHAQDIQTVFLDWHPGGQWLAVSDFDSVRIIDVSSGSVVNEFLYISGAPRPSGPVAWNLDGMNLAFADSLQISIWSQAWNPNASQLVAHYDPLNGSSGPAAARVNNLSWSPDNQQLAIHVGSLVDIVRAATGERQNRVSSSEFAVNDVAWLTDTRLIVVTRQGYIVTIDVLTGEPETYLIDYEQIDRSNYTGISLHPTNHQAVIGSAEGEIILWNNTGSAAPEYSTEVARWRSGSDYISGVNDITYSPSGQYVAASFRNGSVAFYDAASGEQLVSLSLGGETANNALAWSPDGSQLAYGLPDGGYALFDASTLPGYVPIETAEVSS